MRLRKTLLTTALSLSSFQPHRLVRAATASSSSLSPSPSPSDSCNSNLQFQNPQFLPPFSEQQDSIKFAGNMTRGPVIALSHGGGPLPLLGDPAHVNIVHSLRERVPKLLRLGTPDAPRAIVLVTAHWSERKPTISSGEKHRLEYDYYGFPPASYKLKYDAPGSPDVANEVADAMRKAGLEPDLDDDRGWDHGVFVPMLLINPKADVPIVQVSVLDSESPEDHYKMGKALQSLRDSNVAIIGSGFASFHNLKLMFSGASSQPGFKERNDKWSDAVWEGVKAEDEDARDKHIQGWRDWPSSYEMHPRGGAEHFLPLIVCAGAGGKGEAGHYTDEFMGLDMYSYYWEQ